MNVQIPTFPWTQSRSSNSSHLPSAKVYKIPENLDINPFIDSAEKLHSNGRTKEALELLYCLKNERPYNKNIDNAIQGIFSTIPPTLRLQPPLESPVQVNPIQNPMIQIDEYLLKMERELAMRRINYDQRLRSDEKELESRITYTASILSELEDKVAMQYRLLASIQSPQQPQ